MSRLASQPSVWPVLENVPRALEKNMSSAVVGWGVLETAVRSSQFTGLFESSISLSIFCLIVLSTVKSGVMTFPTIIVELFVTSPLRTLFP